VNGIYISFVTLSYRYTIENSFGFDTMDEIILSTTLNVRDPINFCADKQTHILSELKKIYVGRCYQDCYILSIEEILKSSSCRDQQTNNTGRGYIEVMFRARVTKSTKWDILVGVRLLYRKQALIGEVTKCGQVNEQKRFTPAVVTLIETQEVATLQVGQIIAVRVYRVTHPPAQHSPAVLATLLTCERAAPTYKVQKQITQKQAEPLLPILNNLEELLVARQALIDGTTYGRDRIWFFERLLYTFPIGQSSETQTSASLNGWSGPKGRDSPNGVELISIIDFIRDILSGKKKNVIGHWGRPLELYRSSPIIAFSPEHSQESITVDPLILFQGFLRNIIQFVGAIQDLALVFQKDELLASHENVWAAMRQAQLA